MKITSSANQRIKKVVALRQTRHRRKEGLTIVDGVRECRRLLDSPHQAVEVYMCPSLLKTGEGKDVIDRCLSAGIEVIETTTTVFSKIAYGQRREGVLIVARPVVTELKSLHLPEDPLLAVLESVEKPGNLGAVIRSCDGAGADGVIVCDPSVDVFHPHVIRASLGCVFHIPVVSAPPEEVKTFLQDRGIPIFAASPQGETLYADADLDGPCAFFLGREEKGLSPDALGSARTTVRLPMLGEADSLNVSVSAAVLLYEARRQRGG